MSDEHSHNVFGVLRQLGDGLAGSRSRNGLRGDLDDGRERSLSMPSRHVHIKSVSQPISDTNNEDAKESCLHRSRRA